jgi:hypothetical protein
MKGESRYGGVEVLLAQTAMLFRHAAFVGIRKLVEKV